MTIYEWLTTEQILRIGDMIYVQTETSRRLARVIGSKPHYILVVYHL